MPKSKSASRHRAKPKAAHRIKSDITRKGFAALAGVGANEEVAVLGVRIAFLIHDVSRMRRSAYDQIIKPRGFTRAQWWILAHLSRHDGMMQTQLANVMDVGKASVGTLIERLEANGLIERRPDALDGRAKRVYMLRAGHQIVKQLAIEEAKYNERLLRGLSLPERRELLRMLGLVKQELAQFLSDDGKPEGADEEEEE
ncbi:MAG: MarR family transcriptional regulator [Steroidobacteraceae bacterium]